MGMCDGQQMSNEWTTGTDRCVSIRCAVQKKWDEAPVLDGDCDRVRDA